MTAILNSVQRPCLEPEFIVQVSGVGISSTMAGSLSTPAHWPPPTTSLSRSHPAPPQERCQWFWRKWNRDRGVGNRVTGESNRNNVALSPFAGGGAAGGGTINRRAAATVDVGIIRCCKGDRGCIVSQWCGCQFPLEKRPVLLFKAVAKFPTAGKMRSTSLPSLLPSASMPLLPQRRLKARTVLGFAPTHCG